MRLSNTPGEELNTRAIQILCKDFREFAEAAKTGSSQTRSTAKQLAEAYAKIYSSGDANLKSLLLSQFTSGILGSTIEKIGAMEQENAQLGPAIILFLAAARNLGDYPEIESMWNRLRGLVEEARRPKPVKVNIGDALEAYKRRKGK